MIMLRPSMRGARSTTPTSASCCAIRRRICSPTCGWAISRPRNHIDTRTLSPSLRKLPTVRVLTCRSCSPIFGLRRMPFNSDDLDFLCATRSRLACSYLYFPKSMIRHTGGLAVGATSTRSRPASRRPGRARLQRARTPSRRAHVPQGLLHRLVERHHLVHVREQQDPLHNGAVRHHDPKPQVPDLHPLGQLQDELHAAAVQVREGGQIEDQAREHVRHAGQDPVAHLGGVRDIDLSPEHDHRDPVPFLDRDPDTGRHPPTSSPCVDAPRAAPSVPPPCAGAARGAPASSRASRRRMRTEVPPGPGVTSTVSISARMSPSPRPWPSRASRHRPLSCTVTVISPAAFVASSSKTASAGPYACSIVLAHASLHAVRTS